MLPLSLLKTAQNHPMLVELKNGETYNGNLVSCDNWMNINLKDVICTSRGLHSDHFFKNADWNIASTNSKVANPPAKMVGLMEHDIINIMCGLKAARELLLPKGQRGTTGHSGFGGRGRGGPPGNRGGMGGPPKWGGNMKKKQQQQ
ncbi:unnamed protein product, partial [Meganyctiphanes norvegica]